MACKNTFLKPSREFPYCASDTFLPENFNNDCRVRETPDVSAWDGGTRVGFYQYANPSTGAVYEQNGMSNPGFTEHLRMPQMPDYLTFLHYGAGCVPLYNNSMNTTFSGEEMGRGGETDKTWKMLNQYFTTDTLPTCKKCSKLPGFN